MQDPPASLPHPSSHAFSPPEPVILHSWVPTDPLPYLPHIIGEHKLTRTQWIAGARARKQAYAAHHPDTFIQPVRWVLVENHEPIPEDALQTGSEPSGEHLFSVRAWFNGGLHLGKGGHHLNPGASIPFGSRELPMSCYEVLVGDSSYTCWLDYPPSTSLTVQYRSTSRSISPLTLPPPEDSVALPAFTHETSTAPNVLTNISIEPFYPIEGGFNQTVIHGESTADPWHFQRKLFVIVQASYASGWHPGKAEVGDDHCSISWNGGEVWIRRFRCLAWAPH